MAIQAKEPLEVGPILAKEAKTYDSLWAHRIIIGMPNATSGMLRIDFSHYDPASGEVVRQGGLDSENINVDNLAEAVAEVPEVEAAMAAIIEAIPALRTWQEAQPDAGGE